MPSAGLQHDHPDKVVNDGIHGQFLEDATLRFAVKHVHGEGRFQVGEIGLDFPPSEIQRGQLVRRVGLGVEQRTERKIWLVVVSLVVVWVLWRFIARLMRRMRGGYAAAME